MISQTKTAYRAYQHIPSRYFDKPITKFILDRIEYEGVKTYDDLDDLDKDKLVTLCMSALGSEAFDVIFNHADTDNLESAFRNFMNKPGLCEGHNVAESMRDIAVESIADDMNNLFSELQRKWTP